MRRRYVKTIEPCVYAVQLQTVRGYKAKISLSGREVWLPQGGGVYGTIPEAKAAILGAKGLAISGLLLEGYAGVPPKLIQRLRALEAENDHLKQLVGESDERTLGAIIAEYVSLHRGKTPKAMMAQERYGDYWSQRLGSSHPHDLTYRLVLTERRHLEDTGRLLRDGTRQLHAPNTVANYLAWLHACLKGYLSPNHLHRIWSPPGGRGSLAFPRLVERPKYGDAKPPITPTELRRLFAALAQPYQLIAEMALVTGLRQGQLVGLRWDMLDWAAAQARLPEAKRHEPRRVELTDAIMERLTWWDSQPHAFNGLVFGVNGGQISYAFRNAVHAANLSQKQVTFHTLRHLMGSLLAEQGASGRQIQLAGGWCDLGIAQRYQDRVDARDVRPYLEQVSLILPKFSLPCLTDQA